MVGRLPDGNNITVAGAEMATGQSFSTSSVVISMPLGGLELVDSSAICIIDAPVALIRSMSSSTVSRPATVIERISLRY